MIPEANGPVQIGGNQYTYINIREKKRWER
jgi:hypothetical protein